MTNKQMIGLVITAMWMALGAWLGQALVAPWVREQIKQVEQAQFARTNFAVNCVRQKGYTIRLNKADVTILCIGPDGRVIGRY